MKFKIFLFIFLIIILAVSSLLFLINNKNYIISFYNQYRPYFLNGGGKECIKNLKNINASFKYIGNSGSKDCPILNAVKIKKYNQTILSSSFIASCPTALNIGLWLDEIKAKKITHVGTLNCRKRRFSGIQSEHSFGLAIDVTQIDNSLIRRDWKKSGKNGEKLRNAAKSACNYFSNILTPNTNKLHYDHLHLDNGLGLGCGFTKMISFFRKIINYI
jgi:hypothetical protein